MMRDIDLQERVRDELMRDRRVNPGAIRVIVRDGYAALAGQVDSQEARSAAEWAAGRVAGVKGVDSEIVVSSPAPRIIR